MPSFRGVTMNVLELLSKEIVRDDWTLEDKTFYLYLRSCQLFSYDPRYKFYEEVLNNKYMLNQIENNVIDLENVNNNYVICYSHSEVISEILNKLLGVIALKKGMGHSWVEFNDGVRNIEADSTIGSDIARIKMGLISHGYNPVFKEYGFNNKLKSIATKVNYIDKDYSNHFIEEKISNIYEEFLNYVEPNEPSTFEYNMYKLYTVKELFESFDKLVSFSDKEFCISYLLRKVFNNNLDMHTISLFDNSDIDNWKFINIYVFDLNEDKIYFILDDNYFYQICEYDALSYVKNLDGINKKVMCKR